MDISDAHALQARYAETFAKEGDAHPLQQFEQYRIISHHRNEYPGIGARKLSRRTDMPEARIKGWIHGTQPRGYESYQTSMTLGWFDLDWDDERFHGLNQLVAWVLSGGSISTSYTPVFSVEPDTKQVCQRAVEAIGLGEETNVYQDERFDDSEDLRIHQHQTVLGRMLHCLGAPKGPKAEQRYGLPPYLGLAPEQIKREFARIYLLNRAVERPSRDIVTVREERERFYLESLRGLFESVTDRGATIHGEYSIKLDEECLRDLNVAGL